MLEILVTLLLLLLVILMIIDETDRIIERYKIKKRIKKDEEEIAEAMKEFCEKIKGRNQKEKEEEVEML